MENSNWNLKKYCDLSAVNPTCKIAVYLIELQLNCK